MALLQFLVCVQLRSHVDPAAYNLYIVNFLSYPNLGFGLVCCSAATMALTLANLEGEESFDASMLGQADEVVQERICDDELIVIKR